MTIGEKLLKYFPANIKKGSEIFSSLIANTNTNGTIENELSNSKDYMTEWVNIKDIYSLTEDKLLKVVEFFSYIEKFTDETDKALKNRLSAIFRRGGDISWGSPLNVKHVFEQYFELAEVFIIENTNDNSNNLIENGDFEILEPTVWTFENAEFSKKARFFKSTGALIHNSGFIEQSVDIQSLKTYFLHFFAKGKGKIIVQNAQNEYWNSQKEIWQQEEFFIIFENANWNNISFWCRTKNFEDDTEKLKIKIESESELYVDYVRFFLKKSYPSFTVIIHFDGKNAGKPMALFEGKSDIPAEKYKNAFYYNGAFFTGVMSGFAMDIYTDLLNYLTSTGVKSQLEILSKDYIEGEENE